MHMKICTRHGDICQISKKKKNLKDILINTDLKNNDKLQKHALLSFTNFWYIWRVIACNCPLEVFLKQNFYLRNVWDAFNQWPESIVVVCGHTSW